MNMKTTKNIIRNKKAITYMDKPIYLSIYTLIIDITQIREI